MKDTMTCAAHERIESDALGERAVPATALYGANTVRGKENFPFKGASFGEVATFVRAFAAIKNDPGAYARRVNFPASQS